MHGPGTAALDRCGWPWGPPSPLPPPKLPPPRPVPPLPQIPTPPIPPTTDPDMENVPSMPSAARVFFLARLNLWSEHTHFLSRMAKILSNMLYQAVRGKMILGWSSFPGYVTLPSNGNFTKTNVVNPTLVWLPSLGVDTQAG